MTQTMPAIAGRRRRQTATCRWRFRGSDLASAAAAALLAAGCAGWLPDGGPVIAGPPEGSYDIEITGIEVTQATQSLANDMPLVAGRDTLVRVYARELTGRSVPDVRLFLFYSVGHGTVGGGADGYGGMRAATADVRPDGGDRALLEHSFNFAFDLWMPNDVDPGSPGTLSLRARLDPATVGGDVEEGNNAWPETDFELHVPDEFRLHMVPVRIRVGGALAIHRYGDGPNDAAIAGSRLRYLPFADAAQRFRRTDTELALEPDAGQWDIQHADDWGEILDDLAAIRMLAGAPPGKIYLGMLPPASLPQDLSGLGFLGGRVAAVEMSQEVPAAAPWIVQGGQTLGHELGHLLGLLHVRCSDEEDTDPSYPWPSGPQSFLCLLTEEDPAGYYGADVYHHRLDLDEPRIVSNALDPLPAAFPLMGYRPHRWISPWEYCRALPGVGIPCDLPWPSPPATEGPQPGAGPGFTAALPDPGPVLNALSGATSYLMAGGVLDPRAGTASLAPFYLVDRAELPASVLDQALERRRSGPRADSGHRFSLEDADGRPLHQQPVISGWLAGSTRGGREAPISSLLLRDLLPAPPGLRWIRLRRGETVVAERELSPSAPAVAWSSPRAGDSVERGDVLRWRASDADGDPLLHTVLWSPDDGESWTVLALERSAASLEVDDAVVAELRGARGPGLLRVVTTDGVRSALATLRVTPR